MKSGMQKKMIFFYVIITGLFSLMSTTANAKEFKLKDVPEYLWTDGCAPTAGTMMMAYYAINGYAGSSYSNLIPGGTPPLSTTITPNALVTHAIDTMAHDMGTDLQSGYTTLHVKFGGDKYTPQDAINDGVQGNDLTYGLSLYVKDAGYYASVFTQQIYKYSNFPFTFTFANFVADINAGRPVILTLNSAIDTHFVLGYGYEDTTMSIYFRDTWPANLPPGGPKGVMQWQGLYDGMSLCFATDLTLLGGTLRPFTEVNINSGSTPFPLPVTGISTNIPLTGGIDNIGPNSSDPVPEPTTMILFGTGLAGLVGVRFRKKRG